MPKTKDGGFLMDDGDMEPYTNMFNKTYGKNSKQSSKTDKPKKSATNKRKAR